MDKKYQQQKGLYGDKRSFSVGDLITIDVGESSSLAASQNSVRNRQSQIENAVKQFLFANSKMGRTTVVCQGALKLRPKVVIKVVDPSQIPRILRVG